MTFPLRLRLHKSCPLLIAAGLLASCGTPQAQALWELSNAGIEPSGNALLQAAADQDCKRLGRLLDHGATPAERNWDAGLWKAFEKRDREAARLLLSHGARASTRGPHGLLLVETAALRRDGSFVKLLTDYGCPAGDALYHASVRGDLDMVSLLISCGLPVNVTRIPSRDTPLGAAIRNGQDRVASLLIGNGADVSLRLPEGQAPLHLAIATGCSRTVENLLDAGAAPNTPFDLPVSPAFLKSVRPGVMRWVLKNDRNVTPLMMAADSGIIPTARALIRAGAKTEVRTRSSGLWPINFASRRNDVKMMRLFLGRDPLHEERCIEIRLSEQRARLYDARGIEIFTTRVSTGRAGFGTPTGEYVITNKNRNWTSTVYHVSMPYFQRLSCGALGLHQGNVPAYPASHGCIRVPAGYAARLFSLTRAGDRVRIIP